MRSNKKQKLCIGRESNPGLAEFSGIDDPKWQRPILPLNHQCLLMIGLRNDEYVYKD
jgi:hypothetical protein